MFKSTNKPIVLRIKSCIKLREIKLRKIFAETEKQAIWALIKAQKKKEVIFENKRQRHLNTPLRS